MARGRKSMWAGWGLIAFGVAIAGVMVTSRGRLLSRDFSGVNVEVVDGSLWFCSPSPYAETVKTFGFRINSTSFNWAFDGDPPETINAFVVRFAVRRHPSGGSVEGVLLLWPTALATLVSGVALVVMGRRVAKRTRLGHCPACTYNLSGLAAGAACPECGLRARSASKGEAG